MMNNNFRNETGPPSPPPLRDTIETDQSSRTILNAMQIPVLSLTIVFAVSYTILIFVRPLFRHNKLNWFTANICMTSTCFCVMMLSTNIQVLANVSSVLSCRIQGFLIFMSVCQLMYSHCVAALCRLLAIVYPSKYLFRSTKFALVSIISGWLLSVVFAIPYLFLNGFSCENRIKNRVLSHYTVVTALIVPIILIGVCNLKIIIFVRRSSRQFQDGNSQNRTSHARDVHLLKVLVGTYVVFTVGWIPLFIVQAFADVSPIPHSIHTVIAMLPPIAILLDVLILIFTNQPIRIFLKEYLLKRVRRAQHRMSQTIEPMNTLTVNTC